MISRYSPAKAARALQFVLASVCVVVFLLWLGWTPLYHRYISRIPFIQKVAWQRTLARHKARVAVQTAEHANALNIFLGDSLVEGGDWSAVCPSLEIRNWGLSMAKIQDVAEIASASHLTNVHAVVILCGINNLGAGDSVDACVAKYTELLMAARNALRPEKLVVLSVLPVQELSRAGETRDLNPSVAALNRELKKLCRKNDAIFLDVASAVASADGALSSRFAIDAWHLNAAGYEQIGSILCKFLTQNPPKP